MNKNGKKWTIRWQHSSPKGDTFEQKTSIGQTLATIATTVAAIFVALLSLGQNLPSPIIGGQEFDLKPLIAIVGVLSLISAAFVVDYFMDRFSQIDTGISPKSKKIDHYKYRFEFLSKSYFVFCSFYAILFFIISIMAITFAFEAYLINHMHIGGALSIPISLYLSSVIFLKLFSYDYGRFERLTTSSTLLILLILETHGYLRYSANNVIRSLYN